MDNWIIQIGHFSGPTIDKREVTIKANGIYHAITFAEEITNTEEVIYSIQREDAIED
jgi:hypothetical protein